MRDTHTLATHPTTKRTTSNGDGLLLAPACCCCCCLPRENPAGKAPRRIRIYHPTATNWRRLLTAVFASYLRHFPLCSISLSLSLALAPPFFHSISRSIYLSITDCLRKHDEETVELHRRQPPPNHTVLSFSPSRKKAVE